VQDAVWAPAGRFQAAISRQATRQEGGFINGPGVMRMIIVYGRILARDEVIDNHSHLQIEFGCPLIWCAMYVCICKAVSETAISQAVDRGVSNMRELARVTGCSSQCGRCAPQARETLTAALSQRLNVVSLAVSNSRAA
jgi:bacterioferritin-associated ferredoxin